MVNLKGVAASIATLVCGYDRVRRRPEASADRKGARCLDRTSKRGIDRCCGALRIVSTANQALAASLCHDNNEQEKTHEDRSDCRLGVAAHTRLGG
jgi:hypothetical protein